MKYLILLVVVFLFSLEANAAVGGYAYLSDKTNHEGIQVKFDSVSLTARTVTTQTNSDGYYSVDVKPGIYKVSFYFSDYDTCFLKNGENILIKEGDVLKDVSLVKQKATVWGYAYLSDKTNHEGILVTFDSVSLTARSITTKTNSNGYYSLELKPGIYRISYNYTDYETYFYQNGKEMLIKDSIILGEVTLYFQNDIIINQVLPDTLYKKNTYLVTSNLFLFGGSKFYIEPGTKIKFQKGFIFYTSSQIKVNGTKQEPIVFTSDSKNPSAGDWGGLVFNNYIYKTESELSYCIIEYAGTGITIDKSNPDISNCVIRNSKDYGILLSGSNSHIFNNEIQSFGESGIYADIGGTPVIECNRIFNGNIYGIQIKSSSASIRNNIIYDMKDPQEYYQTHGILIEQGNNLIENNYIYNNYYGIKVNGEHPISAKIVDNTVKGCNVGIQFGSVYQPAKAFGLIKNNIVANCNRGISQVVTTDELPTLPDEVSYNLLWNTKNFSTVQILALGDIITQNPNGINCDTYYNIFVEPLFDEDNMPGLLANSPAINSGDPNTEEPDGTASDIGANFILYYCGNDTILDVEEDFPLYENPDGLLIYPNPAGDEIVIAEPSEGWRSSEGYWLVIYNSIGESVLSAEIKPTDSHSIIVSHLPSGVYSAVLTNKFSMNSICGRLVIVR